MSAGAPKFCKRCQELVYSSICPFCECKPSSVYEDEDELATPDVSSGGRWGEDDLSTNMISYDELYSDDVD